MSHRHGELHVVAEGGLDHLRRLERALAAIGIASEVVAPPREKCSS
ncbi:MAG: hypothetical protein JNK02_07530 [Planctomycetes bacterium]|nr:hypothetical protein [Planctomycetota bacterium]